MPNSRKKYTKTAMEFYKSNKKTSAIKNQYQCLSADHPDPHFLLVARNFTRGTHVIFYKGLYFDIRCFHLDHPNVDIKDIVYTGIVVRNQNPDCIIQTYGTIKLETRDDVTLFGFKESQYGCNVALGTPSDQFTENEEITVQIWSDSSKLSLLRIGILHRHYNPFKVVFRFFGPDPPILPINYNSEKCIIDSDYEIIELGTFVKYCKNEGRILEHFWRGETDDSKKFGIISPVFYSNSNFTSDHHDVPARVIAVFFHHTPTPLPENYVPCFTTPTEDNYKDKGFLGKSEKSFTGVLFVCRNECSYLEVEDDNIL